MKPILIWDWDGTLVDSLRHKYVLIWDQVFLGQKEQAEIARTFVRSSEGKSVNRYGIIAHVLRQTGHVLPEDNSLLESNALIRKYAVRYKESATTNTNSAGLLPNVFQTLQLLYESGYTMYIVSGGGTDADLRALAQSLNIHAFFADIYGFGPNGSSVASFGKEENMRRIMARGSIADSFRYVGIGDSETDARFAGSFNMDFVGIANEWNEWKVKPPRDAYAVIDDVSEVVEILDKRAKE